ncbi:TM2 domain-containing protein [Paenibacillus tianmuensis]|uniref:TM2 domain-containing protein n=1 Tax=Paenibacillus tianmuensis TaxID=624147 RepID=A0A1G4RHB3_9BACL|nr:TM2 domain-containing protein [Paenibacillus tianmuensis]SCW56021.1 TM2 domain-containing protein [Paenibacillus tianmuensis]
MDYNAPQNQEKSSKSFVSTLLLAIFFGSLGMHRFYAGKVGTAFLMIFTLGGFGIWTLIDFIMICLGRFTDSEGKPIKN